jgi:hypothetical protein
MAQRTDLYSILTSYANKNNSPYIEIEPCISFIEKYAKQISVKFPEWLKWTQEVSVKFWSEISALAEEGKCELLSDTPEGRIYMPLFYVELLRQYYRDIDNKADLPFPSEESLRIEIPENQKKFMNAEYDLSGYLEQPQEDILPLVQLAFPEGFGAALILTAMIPKKLMEVCFFKIRFYLQNHGNMEFALHKLTPQFQGKEAYLRDILNNIIIRPSDCLAAMEAGSDFSYFFWGHFGVLVKNDIKKKKEPLSEDLAAFQAIYLLEIFNLYYKKLAVKKRERELAFKELELRLEKPPFLYTLGTILKFTNSKGVLLLSKYTTEELNEWLKVSTTESKDKGLPNLLIISGAQKERAYVLKSKLLLLCARLLAEARGVVKDAVSKHWLKLLREYRREPAMDNDKDFETLLLRYSGRLCAALTAVLEDPKLQLVYNELEQSQGIPSSSRIFIKGIMIPYSSLLLLRRKDLLTDTKILLPFWYSMPILTAILAFFKNLGKKKRSKKDGKDAAEEEEQELSAEKDGNRELRNAAKGIEAALVPPQHTLDTYLSELENRWSRLINKQARANLIEDVKSLVRDNLRQTLRVHKHYKLSMEALSQLASGIVNRTPSLQTLHRSDSLQLYVELYLIKLMETVKF